MIGPIIIVNVDKQEKIILTHEARMMMFVHLLSHEWSGNRVYIICHPCDCIHSINISVPTTISSIISPVISELREEFGVVDLYNHFSYFNTIMTPPEVNHAKYICNDVLKQYVEVAPDVEVTPKFAFPLFYLIFLGEPPKDVPESFITSSWVGTSDCISFSDTVPEGYTQIG